MPYADNNGVRIHYETAGQGPPLVLAHGKGAGGDLEAWRQTGYTDLLSDTYRLILLDFRGHGKSDRPDGAAAENSSETDDVTAVLDDLGIEKAHYLGYSMGASFGFRQAVNHPDRFFSFILGGMTPGPWPDEMLRAIRISAQLDKLLIDDPDAYFNQIERLKEDSLTSEEKLESLAGDIDVDAAIETPHQLELTSGDLMKIDIPCLLYCGDRDPFHDGAQQGVQFMPRGVFISLQGLDHITAFTRSDVVTQFVRQFLNVVIRNLPDENGR